MADYSDYDYKNADRDHVASYIAAPLISMLSKEQNKKILDIGCGNGWLAGLLIEKGFDAYGIDASETGIAIARKRHPDRFFVQNVEVKELPAGIDHIPFDTIISTEVIEHLYSPLAFLKFCRKILERNGGGELVITTPYHGYLKNLALALTGKMDAHYTALWEGGHIKFFSKKTLSQALDTAGFEVTEFIGCGRIPYLWKSMLVKARIGGLAC